MSLKVILPVVISISILLLLLIHYPAGTIENKQNALSQNIPLQSPLKTYSSFK